MRCSRRCTSVWKLRVCRPSFIAPAIPRLGRSDLLFDARGLASEFAEIEELGPSDVAAALHLDRMDRRAVGLEHALDAFAVRHLAHRECRIEAAIALGNDD